MSEQKRPKISKMTIQQNVRKPKRHGRIFNMFCWLGQLIRSKKRHGQRPSAKTIFSYLFVLAAAFFLAGTVSFIGLFVWISNEMPDPNNIITRRVAETTKIYDRTGETVLYALHGDEKRTLVELDYINPHTINATLVAEDRNFYEHKGYSLKGIARAILRNFQRGGRGQGGSTITQQFVKNAVLSPEKTYTRKIKELVMSIEIERRFNKDEILKMYLNEIPYGSVVYGIESASDTFFGKSSSDLTISESALLAALPQATTYYSPYGSHTDDLISRQQWIINSMNELGFITQEQADEALEDDVLSRIQVASDGIISPHFVFYVREILAEEYGEQLVERGGLKIITTLDIDRQTAAEEVITEQAENLAEWEATNAALLSFDAKSGDILAMVGSADYFNDEISGKYNSLLGLRQPGSSIKPFVYATAFEKGFTPSTVIYDVVTRFGAGGYTPKNHDFAERGPVTMKEALASSLNIPAVKTLYLADIDDFVSLVERSGYTTLSDRDRFGLSVALGGGEVRPIEHISAFSVFANEGKIIPTRAILKVEDRDGNVLMDVTDKKPASKEVFNPEIARQISDILSDNAARSYTFGENNYLNLGRPAGAKTGTTNNYKDAWTIGFTPSLVTGVWVGNADGSKMKAGAGGSTLAAPIWNGYMQRALEGSVWEVFTPPEPVETGKLVLDGEKQTQVIIEIDSITGKLATEYTPEELIEERGFGIPHSILYFIDKNNPRGDDPENPEEDPMFEYWEKAVADWIDAGTIEIEIEELPTEYDDIHVPENTPIVELMMPRNGEAVTSRDMFVNVNASSKRGVKRVTFLMDGDEFAEIIGHPFSRTVFIPNRFSKGFHTLTATAYDDVGNRASVDITVNLTAGAGPIGVQWLNPYNSQMIRNYQFPYTMKFRIDDYQSIESLQISAISLSNGSEEIIGSIQNPPLSNMSMTWDDASGGRYRLRLEANLVGGETKTEEILVTVQ
ncbi:MAG: transglycosylase domain-containing protein [Patescibacteria group bacterium]|nr:transglycosylase domain-containing protein [Patescibacteria group bacterium]